MSTRAEIQRFVEDRAGGRCEYCRMYQSLQGATFHVEHIVPSSRGGVSEPNNLAWACPTCNLHKSDRTDALDSELNTLVLLFNPRVQRWDEHFRWETYRIKGRTAVGSSAIHLLDLNHHRRQLIRQAEELFGLFPP